MLQRVRTTETHSLSLRELGNFSRLYARLISGNSNAILNAVEYVGTLGDRVQGGLGKHQFLVLQHPNDIQQVLLAPHQVMKTSKHQAGPVSIRREGAQMVTNSDGVIWKHHKTQMAQFMNAKQLKLGTPDAGDADIAAHIKGWHNQTDIPVAQESSRLALKYMFAAIFNSRASTQECDDFHRVAKNMHDYLFMSVMSLRLLPKSMIKQITKVGEATQTYDRSINRLLDEYTDLPESDRDKNILSRLLPEDWQSDGRHQAISSISEVMIASHLSVRTSFYWALHHLARRPDLQERIRAESTKPVTSGCPFHQGKEQELPTVIKLVHETTRLYPPFFIYLKEAAQDFEGAENLNIAKGTTVLIASWLAQRDARWWHKPETFDPDLHFSAQAIKDRSPFAHTPFGKGGHKCIGEGMAMNQMAATLTQVCNSYILHANDDLPGVNADVFLKPENESRILIEPVR